MRWSDRIQIEAPTRDRRCDLFRLCMVRTVFPSIMTVFNTSPVGRHMDTALGLGYQCDYPLRSTGAITSPVPTRYVRNCFSKGVNDCSLRLEVVALQSRTRYHLKIRVSCSSSSSRARPRTGFDCEFTCSVIWLELWPMPTTSLWERFRNLHARLCLLPYLVSLFSLVANKSAHIVYNGGSRPGSSHMCMTDYCTHSKPQCLILLMFELICSRGLG